MSEVTPAPPGAAISCTWRGGTTQPPRTARAAPGSALEGQRRARRRGVEDAHRSLPYPVTRNRKSIGEARAAHALPGGSMAVDRFVRVRGAREHNLQGRRRRHPARRAGGVHRHLRLRQVVARLRHALRRGAAPLLRVGLAVRAAADRPGRRARRRLDRGPAAGGGAAAAARLAERALLGRQRHHAVEPWCGCCTRAPAAIRRASRCSTPRTSRRTRRRAPARTATASAACSK